MKPTRHLVDFGAIDQPTYQLIDVGRRPLRILSRQTPQASPCVANLDVKDSRMGNSRVDDLATHGAKQRNR